MLMKNLDKARAAAAAKWKKMSPAQRRREMARRMQLKEVKRVKRSSGAGPEASLRNLEKIGRAGQGGTFLEHVAYLFGRTERELEHYARSNQLSFAALAEGMASLLQRAASGKVLGT
jgi:hypothetical protein